jgi:hypothetical protein
LISWCGTLEYEVGVLLPLHGWMLHADVFRTSAANYFDHSVGNSNVFFPLTIDGALIRRTQHSLSARMGHRGA